MDDAESTWRGRFTKMLDTIRDSGEDWPVVTEADGSRWVDRDWLIAEFEKAIA